MEKVDLKQFQDVLDKYPDDPTVIYSKKVLSGEKLAGDLIQRACYRQLNDLQRQWKDDDFKFEYRPELSTQIIEFSRLLKNLETHDNFVLSEYQEFLISMLQAWVNPNIDGAKRFDRAFISMSRGNGKTAIMAILALYNFLFGMPRNNRAITVTSADSAHTEALYSYMRAQSEPLFEKEFSVLKDRLGIESNKLRMYIESQSTTMTKLSAESKSTSDGTAHYSYAIVDEFHLFKNMDFVNSITSGQAFLPYSQIIFISTAGTNIKAPMYADYRRYADLFTSGQYSNIDNILFLNWSQDSADEVDKPETWIKSNPLFEIDEKRIIATDKLISERDELRANGKLPDFLVKNMNLWQNAKKDSFISVQAIEKSIIPQDDFVVDSRDVFIGLDFSATTDDFGIGFVYPYQKNSENKYHLIQHSFVPTEHYGGNIISKEKADQINYRHSEELGFATISTDPYGQIDQEQIFWWLAEQIDLHDLNVQAICYDAWQSKAFIDRLEQIFPDILLLPVKQTIPNLYEPTKWLRDGLIRGSITTFDDEIMMASLSNAIITGSPSGYKIDKAKATNKIDCVDAIVDALYEGMYYFDNFTNIEEPKKKSIFDGMTPEQIDEYYRKITF